MVNTRELAEKLLAQACQDMSEHGEFMPQAVLIGDEQQIFVAIDGNIMNSRMEKRALAEKMRAECRRIDAHSTVFVSDTFFSELSPEQHAKKRLIEQMLGAHLDVEQMEAAGLATKREAIMVLIQTKQDSAMLRRPYRRVGKMIAFDERTETSGSRDAYSGIMTGWLG